MEKFASEAFERNGCLHMNSLLILKGFLVCNFYLKNRGMNSMLFLKDFLVSYLKKNVEYHKKNPAYLHDLTNHYSVWFVEGNLKQLLITFKISLFPTNILIY